MAAEAEHERSPSSAGWADDARARLYDSGVNRAFYHRAMARLLDGVPELAGAGLDLGCGTGFSTEVLLARFPSVSWQGIDRSSAMLALAGRKTLLRPARLREGRAEALPFAEHSFDVVVANFAWHWFGKRAGSEIRRVLRPGGWLLASVPLRKHSQASGNRALARALLADRRHFSRRGSQGLRFDDVRRLLPGPVRVVRIESFVERESFADGCELLDVLASRGALAAIFGDRPPVAIVASPPVEFEWPFAVLHVQI